ncbi:MAG: hypothetical protein ACT4PV_04000 [Planctomycetaceae bacterium]
MRTHSRTEQKRRRPKKKEPSPETLLRIEWLNWLIAEHGADAVAEWDEPPVSFEEWRRRRALAAFEAA